MTNNTAIQETDEMKQQWTKHIEQGASMTDNFAKEMLSVSKMKGSFEYTITNIAPPKPVGWWVIGDGFQVAMYKKPTDEHIKNHYEMLGWKWRDAA